MASEYSKFSRDKPWDDIVISGIAGMYPESDNIHHLGQNLLAKEDLITEDERRWKSENKEIPQRSGKIKELDKFDAAFFRVHARQAHSMDPLSRMLLEKTYEAIVDAGYNPNQLKKSNTGVFLGISFAESEKTLMYDKSRVEGGLGLTGCSHAMFANRISYWLDVVGPSYSLDTACSSSMYALEQGYRAIRDGACDAAIVGCGNLCLHPAVSHQYGRLGVLSPDGKCKSFDESGNGYCRSEATVVMFLQKAKNARRVYARLVHTKTNCDGYTEKGITNPSAEMQTKLMEAVYAEAGVDPNSVEYVEAHGTGTQVGDPTEVNSLETIFCRKRKSPLKIGSIKSNMGHSETASGLCGISKIILGFELGVILPNIHLKKLRPDIGAFHNGNISVVTEPTPWKVGLAAVNNFGFGGANCHALLEANPKTKVNGRRLADGLPRLVVVSGRTMEAVDVILSDFERRPLDVEYVRLMHAIQSDEIPGHVYRGYTLLKANQGAAIRHIERFSGEKRPIWFIFTGMGCHWPSMGTALMKIPICAAAIHKCHQLLKPLGVDLIDIITNEYPNIFDVTVNSFIGIGVVQIALVDLLSSIGISPAGMVGYSLGELGCAYADGCLTLEQMILAAYYRGLTFDQTELMHGTMASVGLGHEEARRLLPPEIDIACHNGSNNCSISGPTPAVKKFLAQMKEKGVFVKEVSGASIAYHSRYIDAVEPQMMAYMKKVIPESGCLRSGKWICTTAPEADWSRDIIKYATAEYFTRSLLNPVYFEEGLAHIPDNAITIEIAPHGLLQSLLKRNLKPSVINISLSLRNSTDNLDFLITAIGKLFEAGANPQIHELYPAVEFPVSRGTPMISPLIRWEHSSNWFVAWHALEKENQSGGRTIVVSLADNEFQYLQGHVIDGRNLYPATGYLVLVWETLSQILGQPSSSVSVVFENVKFERSTNIPKEGEIIFTVMIQKASGNFEVVEGDSAVASGRIYIPESIANESINMPPLSDNTMNSSWLPLSKNEVYKELNLRGYNYSGSFKGINYANNEGTVGRIGWTNNFVLFMDNMLQMKILGKDTRSLYVPTAIQKLVINTEKHFEMTQKLNQASPEFPVYVYQDIDLIQSGGIEIKSMKTNSINRKAITQRPVLQKHQFVPYVSEQPSDLEEVVRICTHIAIGNLPETILKTVELFDCKSDGLISKMLVNTFEDFPSIQADITVHNQCETFPFTEELEQITVINQTLPSDGSCSMIIASHVLNRKNELINCLNSLKSGGFLLTRENAAEQLTPDSVLDLDVCFDHVIGNERLLMLRTKAGGQIEPLVIKITNDSYSWISQLQHDLDKLDVQNNQRVVIYTQDDERSGILGFFNCLRKEFNGEHVRCFFIANDSAPSFSLCHPMYRSQFMKDMALNVYKNGTWGGYFHLPIGACDRVETPHAFITPLMHGDLSTLQWIEGPLNPTSYRSKTNNDLVHVYYASLNFRDIMMASGKLSLETLIKSRLEGDCTEGFEYAGKTTDGRRVMGMTLGKGMASLLEGDVDLMWDVPDKWTLEEAATIPVVYATVLYALFMCGRMKPGESILIHAGTGGVGQAAIHVCLHYGCTVFTTVGSSEKRQFIKKTFPAIPDSRIGNSRDTSFEQLIMMQTKGRGVDLVLNSLAEDKLQASVRCLAAEGRFLEIGRTDIFKNSSLGMEHFSKEIQFSGVFLDKFFYASKERKVELKKALENAIADGAVKPLDRTIFDTSEVETAFRFMAAGKHIGKVILQVRNEEPVSNTRPITITKKAIPRFYCCEEKVYVVCGGLGGFGLELIDWLILRGARMLVVTSRKGINTGYQAMKIRLWQSYDVNVNICRNNMATEEDAKELLKTANSLGPVAAIFNLAMVLRDAAFQNQNEKLFSEVLNPKARATFYLDRISRLLCPRLEQFVVFSSVSCGYGNAGQTNYGMANSITERICELRRAAKLPALAIQWGAVGDVGLVAEMAEDNKEVVVGGTLQQSIRSCLEVLDYFMKQPNPVVSSIIIAGKRIVDSTALTLREIVANILGITNLETISSHSTLADLGLDSMMTTEIKQTMDREFEIFLTPREIRQTTFHKLLEIEKAHGKKKDINRNNLIKTIVDRESEYGLGKQYFEQLTEDDLASNPIVKMPSLFVNGFANDDSAVTYRTIFVIPGVEGIAKLMEPLTMNLNAQVYCLQYGTDYFTDNVKEIAENLIVRITDRLAANQKFYIVGYSYGGLIALEMVQLLEKQNKSGQLCLVDSSPEFLKTVVQTTILSETVKTDDKLQVSTITRFLENIWPEVTSELEAELYKQINWDARLELAISRAPSEIESNVPHLKVLITARYYRLKSILKYKTPDKKSLCTPTTLIRPKNGLIKSKVSTDYDLPQYFKLPVKVHFVEGDHLTMLKNKETADLIMREPSY